METGELSNILKEWQSNAVYRFDAIAVNVNKRLTKNGKEYLDFELVAGDDTVSAKKWDSDSADSEIFKQGQLLSIIGTFTSYQDKLQCRVDSGKIISDEERFKTLLPIAPNHDQLCVELKQFFALITDSDYQKIINHIFNDQILQKFCQNRAGLRIHHSVYGGLLWHTVSMLKVAQKILPTYDYLPIDASLLYAGIILHDVGKIDEIGDYFQSQYSLPGKLLGHISIGASLVLGVAKELSINQEKTYLLSHLILASHGKLENGAAVEPGTIEAVILSQLDDLDAKVGALFNEIKKVQKNEFIPSLYLEGKKRNFYLHHLKK